MPPAAAGDPERPEAASPDDPELDEADAAPEKKTASNVGSIETEKVTDFAEEKETKVDENTLKETLKMLDEVVAKEKEERDKRMAALDEIGVKEEDVQLIRDQMDMAEDAAEAALKEHKGDLVATLRALTA